MPSRWWATRSTSCATARGRTRSRGAAVAVPDDAEDVINNNRMRGEIDTALAALKLFSPDAKQRLAAAQALLKEPDESHLALIDKALAAEQHEGVRARLVLARAAVLLGSSDTVRRLQAVRALATNKTPETKLLLNERLGVETEADVKVQIRAAIHQIDAGPALGRAPGRAVHRHQPGQHPAAGRARPGHHLRPDGRDQHGARRADDDRRLRHLCGAGRVPALPARCLRRLPAGGGAGGLSRLGAGGRGAGAQRHPLSLRPPAGNLAGHLGHQPGADAGGAHVLRRAERGGGKPGVDERRLAAAAQPDPALQPPGHHRLRAGRARPAWRC